MTDYEALNRQLLAQKNAQQDPAARKRAADEVAYTNLSEVERLAREFHHLLEARGFPQGRETGLMARWLKFEDGSELLGWMLATEYVSSDEYDSSTTYVMLDGRLMHYYARGGHGGRAGGWVPFEVLSFMPYRQYVDERLRTLSDLSGETARHINRLRYMIGRL